MSLLSVDELQVTYRTQGGPVPAVRGVAFELARGEVLGLAGESGCGKSTIAGAILRLLPKGTDVSGRVLLDDQNVLELKPGKLRAVRWTEASIVFQGAMHALNPVQRIGDQIAEPIILHGQAGERELDGATQICFRHGLRSKSLGYGDRRDGSRMSSLLQGQRGSDQGHDEEYRNADQRSFQPSVHPTGSIDLRLRGLSTLLEEDPLLLVQLDLVLRGPVHR